MRKTIIMLIAFGLISTACSVTTETKPATTQTSKTQITTSISTTSPKETKIEKKAMESIKDGDKVEIKDKYDFTVIGNSFKKKIEPDRKDRSYNFYEAKDPKNILFDFMIEVTSTQSSEIEAAKIANATLIINDKYNYSSSGIPETAYGFRHPNQTVLETDDTMKMHYIFEVPLEVENSAESLVLVLDIAGKSYEYKVR